MRIVSLTAGLAFALAPAGAADAAAQERSLGPAEAVAAESFSLVNTVRELADGRVLVADPLGNVLVRLDRTLQRAETLGREGGGPGEYRQPDAVWPLPGDSTLLVDLGNARLTVIAPDGTFARTRPITLGEPGPGGPPPMVLPRGTDAGGRIYFEGPRASMGGPPPDSVQVLRAGPVGSSTEPVVRVKLPDVQAETSGGATSRSIRMTAVPLSPVDAWGVAASGEVAVARSRPYRLEWVGVDGRVRAGPEVRVTPVRIREAEREEWELERGRSGGGIGISITMENGQASVRFGRGGAPGGGRAPDLSTLPWPEVKPPFVGGAVRVDGAGRAWVQRSLPAGEPPLYDLFDGSGALVGQVRLPPDRRLVGFGEGTLYAVYVDAMDLQTLERYPLP